MACHPARVKTHPFDKPALLSALAIAALLSATALSAAPALPAAPDLVLAGTMAEMTSPEVGQAARDGALVLFPIAIIEEHGPHLDLTPDIVLAAEVCRSMKARLETLGHKVVIVPPYYWGVSQTTHMFPGTFTSRPETMKAVLTDAVACLKAWGFTTIFFVNGHGDPTHRKVQEETAAELRRTLGIEVYASEALDPRGFVPPAFPAGPAGSFQPDYHAGASETAMMAKLRPTSVRPDVARQLKPQAQFLPLGYVGNPAGFEAEDGHGWLRFTAEAGAGRIAAFLKERGATPPADARQ